MTSHSEHVSPDEKLSDTDVIALRNSIVNFTDYVPFRREQELCLDDLLECRAKLVQFERSLKIANGAAIEMASLNESQAGKIKELESHNKELEKDNSELNADISRRIRANADTYKKSLQLETEGSQK